MTHAQLGPTPSTVIPSSQVSAAGGDEQARKRRGQRVLIARPAWLGRIEARLGRGIPLHPHLLSAAKLVLVTPALLWAAARSVQAEMGAGLVLLLLGMFGLLDYLDGVVARERGLATRIGRVIDRLTDYPLLVGLSLLCIEVIPPALLAAKLTLDALLLVLFVLGRGSTQNRLRTALSYAALVVLLTVSQGWAVELVSSGWVTALLAANVALSTLVALNNLGVLKKRFIADLLSFGNLSAGVLAALMSLRGHFAVALCLLLVGAAFDGFDGAAARRWGSTRWGVYSDDVADAVNFAIAPGVAIACGLGGTVGIGLGLAYALFTLGRLVFFTLAKGQGDDGFFAGVPSTVGALVVTSAVVLFREQAALIGLCVGVACAQMVSFASRHRHLGRALSRRPRWLWALLPSSAGLLAAGLLGGVELAVAILLAGALVYGFAPSARAFAVTLRHRRNTG